MNRGNFFYIGRDVRSNDLIYIKLISYFLILLLEIYMIIVVLKFKIVITFL